MSRETKVAETAVYHKKSIPFKHHRKALSFDVSQELFSSHQVDVGTRLLLRTLGDSDPENIRKILDVGCGYGPIGLTLKKLDFMRTVHLVDRDALAVAFTRHNAKQNKLSNAVVYGSLGYDAVQEREFDLIVSNIPGKAGEAVIQQLLGDAVYYLAPKGFVAVVVVTPLAEMVESYLSEIDAEIILREEGSEHVVFHYRFGGHIQPPLVDSAVERGIYFRDRAELSVRGKKMWLQTARGLPEYDTPFFETSMMLKALAKLKMGQGAQTLFLNPGQGYVPLAVWGQHQPKEMTLLGRDLLSLNYSQLNLVANGCDESAITLLHEVGLEKVAQLPYSLITQMIPKGQSQAVTEWLVGQLYPPLAVGGHLLIGGGSTAVTRAETFIKNKKLFKIKTRKKSKGRSLLLLYK